MNEFLGKISSYNLFNYLFSGVVFVVLCDTFTPYSFIQEDIMMGIFLYYFIGMIFSRIGSLLIEPVLKGTGFIQHEPYSNFVAVSKNDVNLEIFSEVNNVYRTMISVLFGVIFFKVYGVLKIGFMARAQWEIYLLLILLLALFLFAYRKQTSYITKRIKASVPNI